VGISFPGSLSSLLFFSGLLQLGLGADKGHAQRAQQGATPNREQVRETVAQVRAPRQTLRSPERTSKKGKR